MRRIELARDCASDLESLMNDLILLFPDHCPALIGENNSSWLFELRWPHELPWYIDENIEVMARRCFQLDLASIAEYYREDNWDGCSVILSMSHSWALLNSFVNVAGESQFTHIVHVDAHEDLMPCLVSYAPEGGVFCDSLDGCCCLDLTSKPSLIRAVKEGTVNKGSFLTALALLIPSLEISHVLTGSEQDYWLRAAQLNFLLGSKKCQQSELIWEAEQAPGLPRLMQRPRIAALSVPSDAKVWLDIDLDYFCNRYDGDSDRAIMEGDEKEKMVLLGRLEELLHDLQNSPWRRQVKKVSIALSPGFFPSEYWHLTLPILLSGLRESIGSL
jgi:hypothetical protein